MKIEKEVKYNVNLDPEEICLINQTINILADIAEELENADEDVIYAECGGTTYSVSEIDALCVSLEEFIELSAFVK